MKRVTWMVVLVALGVVALSLWFVFRPQRTLPDDPLAMVPADAYGVVHLQVGRILASDAFKRLVVEQGQAEGMLKVERTCGYNPLARIRDAVVFARPSPDGKLPRFSFAARGDLRHDELVDCVQKVSGVDRSKLRTETIDGVITVQSSKGNSRAAFVGRDGIIGGDADTVAHVIHVIGGKAPSIATDPLLTGLFREVAQGQDVALVAKIPKHLQPELARLSDQVLGGILKPLSRVRALSANARFDENRVRGGAVLLAEDENEAAAIIGLARAQIDRVLRIPGVSLTPAGGVLRGIEMEGQGDRATFAGQVNVSTVEAMLELLPALSKMQGLLTGSAEPAPAAGAKAPDAGTGKKTTTGPAP